MFKHNGRYTITNVYEGGNAGKLLSGKGEKDHFHEICSWFRQPYDDSRAEDYNQTMKRCFGKADVSRVTFLWRVSSLFRTIYDLSHIVNLHMNRFSTSTLGFMKAFKEMCFYISVIRRRMQPSRRSDWWKRPLGRIHMFSFDLLTRYLPQWSKMFRLQDFKYSFLVGALQ